MPFYVHEECFCQPSKPELAQQYHNETLAACEQVAAKIQISRTAARRLPLAPEPWINQHNMISLGEQSALALQDNNAPYTAVTARRKSAFEAAMQNISGLVANRARHQHSAQTLPPRGNPRAPSVPEQELRRRRLHDEEYKIICRGVVYQPTQDNKSATTAMAMYIGFQPIPVLFIFLAMVLACTTITEWALDTWQRYSARIRLRGAERVMYADVATLPSTSPVQSQPAPREKTGETDVEKRAEA